MKSFSCQKCGQSIFFENDHCLRCESKLGFIFEEMTMSAFSVEEDLLRSYLNEKTYKYCENCTNHKACNWVLEIDSEHKLCLGCRLNRTIPNLSIDENMRYWRILESGKRRLLYSLIRLGLPVIPKSENDNVGLAFEFLKDTFERIQKNDYVMTGHIDGVITLNIAEADDVERERRKQNLNEDYRTVLGHFRHESGHYYWQQLVWGHKPLKAFRHLFGDERLDYQEAVTQNYEVGAPENWPENFISAYASCHPWEDFAETWGHYLLIADTLETAKAFFDTDDSVDGYHAPSFDVMLKRWLPLTLAVNNINRSGGQPDLYPFVLSAPVVAKLTYIHQLIHARETF
tara:strand:- start:265 stop:1296 length:1032 start_codon:yes stop_codon:yes gene_type:complete